MSKSVSNDALWVKLSEINEKLSELATIQKPVVPRQEQVENRPDLKEVKDEIISKITEQTRLLGIHHESHFKANTQNIETIIEIVQKVWNIVSRIRKQQREIAESQKTDNTHFNFRFFKVRKTSVVIVILGILVFILTLFCMKQQSDYSLLMDEYYRQGIEIRKMQADVKSVKNK